MSNSPFEQNSEQYDAWFEKHPFAYQSELEAIRMLLPDPGRGLEIGVGSGLFAAPLGIGIGVEPSIAMAERAKQRGITVVKGVAEALPFQDHEFDTVLMVTMVCFLDDIDLAFQEAFRVLKPGGAFIIGFVDRNSVIGKAYEQRKNESLFYKDATFYSVDDLLAHLKQAGFSMFSFSQTLFSPINEMREPDLVKKGYGEGSFVVIKAEK
ncbi:MAG: methyltransferase type 11 [Nitrospirae bacterium GWC2_56_14]|nr:MAG: methyltransferase type 11 [Nitrospirae bacterium GWC2_56_14]